KTICRLALIILLSLITTGCATTPVLHVIGVYEGQTPAGADDRPWWAKSHNSTDPSVDNRRESSKKRAEKEISVEISDDTKPIILALTAYDKTLWKVSLKEGVKLIKVILGGYHSQQVTGIPPQTPIEAYTYYPSPCEKCWQSGEYFYSYKNPPKQLKKITGLEPTSFQGRYRGSKFSIFPEMKKIE
ncbi:MAG: hypothetical protein OEL55_03500, partial [Desulfobulbaceae bacterium]|nr:hypothetical protein [Desulfobulbaceae bacterium]